eukprot:402574-Pelagomonas_calceolata.AAC.1
MMSAAQSEYRVSLRAWTLRSLIALVGHRRSSTKAALLKILASCVGIHGPLSGAIKGVVPCRAGRKREIVYHLGLFPSQQLVDGMMLNLVSPYGCGKLGNASAVSPAIHSCMGHWMASEINHG